MALAAAMALSLVACGSNGETPSSNDKSSGGEVTGLTEAIAEQPILQTSGGQSADYAMIATVLEKLGMDITSDATVKAGRLGRC